MDDSVSPSGWVPYLRWMVGTALAFCAGVGAFNGLVDPLGVFDAPRWAGFNQIKPYLDHHRELSRWRLARRLCASAGIFGNSRAEIGFDPEHPGFQHQGLVAFNHAIPGASLSATYRQIQWLRTVGCEPQTLILGLDFFDFLGDTRPASAAALPVGPPPDLDGPVLAETVFSITGLRDSLHTVRLQYAPYPATRTDRGFNPLYQYIPEVEQSGHYILFRQRAEENLRNWRRTTPSLRAASGEPSANEKWLDAMVRRGVADGRRLYLVIYPYHAQIRLMMERLGLSGLFDDWRRNLVKSAAAHAGGPGSVEVWDFSGISPMTLEAIPPRGDRRTQLRYYWEAGHFKKALGDEVITRLLHAVDDWGIRLDNQNIESWLAEDRRRVEEQLTAPSALRAEVDDLFSRGSPGRSLSGAN